MASSMPTSSRCRLHDDRRVGTHRHRGASSITVDLALTHPWLGGIGFVVLALAVLPKLAVGGQQLMDVEAPGPETEKLTPRIAETARRLWVVYLGLTAAELAILLAIGYGGLSPQMDFFNALAHTFATISTGGFSPNARSVEPLTRHSG